MDKLGFTFYPQDWWTSDSFFEFNPFERYVYLECLFLMYRNDGYMKTQKTQFENRIKILVTDEIWEKITGKFIKDEKGYTSLTVNKRLRKAGISRVNGQKGGRPKKGNNPENPTLKPKEKGKEKTKENLIDEKLSEWEIWGKQIVNDQDQYWQAMKGKKISVDEMNNFLSVATRKAWIMDTQQAFRKSLIGFVDLSKKQKSKAISGLIV